MTNCFSFLSDKPENQSISQYKVLNHCFHDLQQKLIFTNLINNKSYIPLPSCLFNHIITSANLSSLEKLYYIFAESLASVSAAAGKQRAVALSCNKWAAKLKCSRSQVFAMQKKLAGQGYFIIEKDKNKHSQNKRNLIIPTVPDSVFEHLCNAPEKSGVSNLPYNPTAESKLGYLSRTKLFVPLNYKLLSLIASCDHLNHSQKVIWLDFYTIAFKVYAASGKNAEFLFFTSYQDMIKRYSLTKSALSKIINTFESNNFVIKKRFFRKREQELNDRQDQSIWQITLTLPPIMALQLLSTQDRKNITLSNNANKSLMSIYQDEHITNSYSDIYTQDDQTEEEFVDDLVDELDGAGEGCGNLVMKQTSSAITRLNALSNDFNSISSLPGLQSKVSCTDPQIAACELHLNKNILINISNNNLGENSKVILNDFVKSFDKANQEKQKRKAKRAEYNICSELIRQTLKTLPKDKADKARHYAYALVSQKRAKGYAENLSKHELAKQLIFHAASWRPKGYSHLCKEKQIDIALASAWKAVENGTWQVPMKWQKAQILQDEFEYYKQKYRETGVLSTYEISDLERVVSSLLGGSYYGILIHEITSSNKEPEKVEKSINDHTYNHSEDYKQQAAILENCFNKGIVNGNSERHQAALDSALCLPNEPFSSSIVSGILDRIKIYKE